MPEPTFTTASVIALFAGSSVLAAIVNQTVSAWRDDRKLKREAAFSALYVALSLEDYASVCSSRISDSENYDASNGSAGTAHGNIAELPEYPETVEWKQFGIASTTKVLSYRVEVENKRAMISDYWEFDDEDSVLPVMREEAARLGKKALDMAIALRKDWKIEPVDYSSQWNVKTYLTDKLAEYEAARLVREERNRKWNEEMLAATAAGEAPPMPEAAE